MDTRADHAETITNHQSSQSKLKGARDAYLLTPVAFQVSRQCQVELYTCLPWLPAVVDNLGQYGADFSGTSP